MLAPGSDTGRWKVKQGAEITGYVFDVKVGGIETTNCGARAVERRDSHIDLVLDPLGGCHYAASHRRGHPSLASDDGPQGLGWSTRALRDRLLGRWIKVKGRMLYDVEHQYESENTAPGRERNWRATAWEVQPVTFIEVVQRPAK
jgi:hypothetical protein